MANKMERFTQRARRVLSLAQEEAENRKHDYIGTEHLLLGLMDEKESPAYRVLRQLGMEYFWVSGLVNKFTQRSAKSDQESLPLSEDVKHTLEYAIAEARDLGHHYIGTEHLLLGMLRQTEGGALEIIKQMNISPDKARERMLRTLQESREAPQGSTKIISKAVQDSIETDMLAILRLRIQADLLSRLLAKLTEGNTEDEISTLLDAALSEHAIILNKQMQSQLLDSIQERFKPEAGKRKLRVHITDKTTEEVIMNILIFPSEARGFLATFAQFFETRPPGKLIILDGDKWKIELSGEDGGQAGAES